jgi:hypothetical protein
VRGAAGCRGDEGGERADDRRETEELTMAFIQTVSRHAPERVS